jgi:hypothetical protein
MATAVGKKGGGQFGPPLLFSCFGEDVLMASPNQPDLGKAVLIDRYETLAVKLRKLHVYCTLVVSGPPGRGKSQLAQLALGDGAVWFGSRSTGFSVYQTILDVAWDPGVVLAFDDVLLRDPQLVGFLMELGDTAPVRTVSWATDAARQRGLPQRVRVANPVLILTNDLRTFREKVALDDRVHHVHFDPAPLEVHLYAAEFFTDQEIFDYVGEKLRLGVVADCSLRMYVKAERCKRAGDDWVREIEPYLVEERLRIAAEIDAQFATREEKARAYRDKTGLSAATYYRDLQALRQLTRPVEVPPLILRSRPQAPVPLEDAPTWLRTLRQPPLN